MSVKSRSKRDGAQLVGGAAVGAGHGVCSGSSKAQRSAEASSGPSRRRPRSANHATSPDEYQRCAPAARRRRRRSPVASSGPPPRTPSRRPSSRARRRGPSRRRSRGPGTGSGCSPAAACRRRRRATGARSRSASTMTSSPRRLAPLDELDEARARRARELHVGADVGDGALVGARRDRADRADHADPPAAGGRPPATGRPARSRRPRGTGSSSASSSRPAAAAVLHATTSSLASCSFDQPPRDLRGRRPAPRRAGGARTGSGRCRRCRRGPRRGTRSITARATVSPPNPESNMPMGRSAIGGSGY